MLQLFASPAGRALLTNDNRPRGSTSTSSLSRESSSRLKSNRRPSGTGTVSAPTSPPRRRKSSAELYKEAVEILGLTCSLTDSCRCIDCQVIILRLMLNHIWQYILCLYSLSYDMYHDIRCIKLDILINQKIAQL